MRIRNRASGEAAATVLWILWVTTMALLAITDDQPLKGKDGKTVIQVGVDYEGEVKSRCVCEDEPSEPRVKP